MVSFTRRMAARGVTVPLGLLMFISVHLFSEDLSRRMSKDTAKVLIVEQDRVARERVAAYLRKNVRCIVFDTGTGRRALEILTGEDIGVMLIGTDGAGSESLELIREAHRINPGAQIIPAVAQGDRGQMTSALSAGGLFYVNFPYDSKEVAIIVARALRFHRVSGDGRNEEPGIRKSDGFMGIVYGSKKMAELLSVVETVAEDDASTVLLQGESGTGKELLAQALHSLSPRSGKNFVPVNCAAIPEELMESEMFGYVKGAFTGANQAKIGRMQYADKGTLFLDEIGDMKPSLQAKLLRVLQEKEFEPVGGVKPVAVNVRVVAATHRNLEELVAAGSFRQDLYYRLNVVPLTIPPLRDRVEDIPPLVETFVHMFNRNKRIGLRGFDSSALEALKRYDWPGNVRELKNLVQRMVVLHPGKIIGCADLPEQYRSECPEQGAAGKRSDTAQESHKESGETRVRIYDFKALVARFEEKLIRKALRMSGGNKKEAAELLSLKRTTFLEKLKKRNIS
jgi:DNA-binding NtrC family response regulator